MKISRTHPSKQGFEKKGATQTDAENLMEADDNYTLEQRNWKTFDLLSFVSTCCPKLWRLSTNLRSCTSGCSDESSKQQSKDQGQSNCSQNRTRGQNVQTMQAHIKTWKLSHTPQRAQVPRRTPMMLACGTGVCSRCAA